LKKSFSTATVFFANHPKYPVRSSLRQLQLFRLVQDTELQVGCRYLENDVLVGLAQGHPAIFVSVRPTDRFEFDINLEIRAVLTDERAA
jgi:hypothetical protein